MQQLVDTVTAELEGGGLRANPAKCKVLSIKVDRKCKKWFVAAQTQITVGGDVISLMGPEDTYKYLGYSWELTEEGKVTDTYWRKDCPS